MIEPLPATIVPQNDDDRRIRRALSLNFDRRLPEGGVNFIVRNGDVSVTGIVRTESDRERINNLAMAVAGVKSVANAVRVSP
jgi:osmotically-inducible protein OsmY